LVNHVIQDQKALTLFAGESVCIPIAVGRDNVEVARVESSVSREVHSQRIIHFQAGFTGTCIGPEPF
jgi:hypothetical protein